MGHQQDVATPCGNTDQNGNRCQGQKVTLYQYDDNGNCVAQHMMPCNVCGC